MIAVIDYGAGNLRSVTNAVTNLGYEVTLTHDAGRLLSADAVIFPGVGAAGEAMERLRALGIHDVIGELVFGGHLLLAICLGMQLLFSTTEEGEYECLGLFPGRVKRLPLGLKIPHMGWNQVRQEVRDPIFCGIPDEANFYFVHSYYVEPDEAPGVVGTTEYGLRLCSVVVKGNLVATQFHPEKSGKYGLTLLSNFLKRTTQVGG